LKAHAFSLTYEVNEPKKTQLQKYSPNPKIKERECHTVALPFTLKRYLKAKEEV
jgi:hypothetical protein